MYIITLNPTEHRTGKFPNKTYMRIVSFFLFKNPFYFFFRVRVLRSIPLTLHGRHGVSNHRHLDCLFNSFFMHTKSNIRLTGPLRGECRGDQCIPLTRPAICGKRFHDMTSQCLGERWSFEEVPQYNMMDTHKNIAANAMRTTIYITWFTFASK